MSVFAKASPQGNDNNSSFPALILIIEDDKEYQDLYDRLFSEVGLSYKIVNHPNDATNLIAQGNRYSAVIVDLAFGGEPIGLELLKRLKQRVLDHSGRSQGPAIVVSAYPQYREKALAFGAERFFEKQTLAETREEFINAVIEASQKGKQQLARLKIQEQETFEDLRKQFLRGEPIEVSIDEDIVNPTGTLR